MSKTLIKHLSLWLALVSLCPAMAQSDCTDCPPCTGSGPCCSVWNACNYGQTFCYSDTGCPTSTIYAGCDMACTPIDSGLIWLILIAASFGSILISRNQCSLPRSWLKPKTRKLHSGAFLFWCAGAEFQLPAIRLLTAIIPPKRPILQSLSFEQA